MPFKDQLHDSLRLQKAPSPWPRMILCTLSVTLPLVAGYLWGDQRSSIYGALLGFILILNDHFGPLQNRVLHLLTSFGFLALAFFVGLMVSSMTWLLIPVLFLMAFMLGKIKGQGIELERMMLFSTFQLLNGALTPGLKEHALQLLIYATISLLNYLICLSLVYLVMKHAPNFHKSKRQELKESLSKKDSHRYALTLASVACLGVIVSKYFHVERAQWMIGTILIVMMPNETLSYQRSIQRIFGTFIGVVIASLVIYVDKDPIILISFSALAAFLAPLGQIRNYWLGNAFIAALIMFFLEFASIGTVHPDYALLRIVDIGLGCLIGTLGTLIAFPASLTRFFKK